MKKTAKQRIIWIFSAVLGIVFLVSLTSYFLLSNVWHKYANAVFESRIKIDQQTQQEFQLLRALNEKIASEQQCSNSILKDMREIEFATYMLKDIAFVRNNQLLCSTRLGLLKQPIPAQNILINSEDSDVYFSPSSPVLDSPHYKHQMAVQIGDLQTYLFLPKNLFPTPNWQKSITIRVLENSYTTFLGDINTPLDQIDYGTNSPEVFGSYFVTKYCDQTKVCTLVEIDTKVFFANHPLALFAILSTMALLIAFIVPLTIRFHKVHISLRNQIKRGLLHDRIACHYQPILNLKSQTFDTVEVLCRWLNEDGDILYPGDFLPFIEKYNRTELLTDLVFEKAVDELKQANLLGKLTLSINFYPTDVSSGCAKRLIKQYMPNELAQYCSVEITEQDLGNIEKIKSEIKLIQSLSAKIAIDDFGTGYSNFKHLEQLQVDTLKIDRSFICGIEKNALRTELVRSIIDIARKLNLNIVAEGVENQKQLEKVTELEIDRSQGYYHSKPVPITQLVKFLDKHERSDL